MFGYNPNHNNNGNNNNNHLAPNHQPAQPPQPPDEEQLDHLVAHAIWGFGGILANNLFQPVPNLPINPVHQAGENAPPMLM